MTMLNPITTDSYASLVARLTSYGEAGIDPAFDAEAEELERQFAELRISLHDE